MLEIKNLVKRYGKFTAVNNLSLSNNEGEIFVFVVPNVAGKTTTMKIVAGLLKTSSGKVFINGIDATAHPSKLRKDRIYARFFEFIQLKS